MNGKRVASRRTLSAGITKLTFFVAMCNAVVPHREVLMSAPEASARSRPITSPHRADSHITSQSVDSTRKVISIDQVPDQKKEGIPLMSHLAKLGSDPHDDKRLDCIPAMTSSLIFLLLVTRLVSVILKSRRIDGNYRFEALPNQSRYGCRSPSHPHKTSIDELDQHSRVNIGSTSNQWLTPHLYWFHSEQHCWCSSDAYTKDALS